MPVAGDLVFRRSPREASNSGLTWLPQLSLQCCCWFGQWEGKEGEKAGSCSLRDAAQKLCPSLPCTPGREAAEGANPRTLRRADPVTPPQAATGTPIRSATTDGGIQVPTPMLWLRYFSLTVSFKAIRHILFVTTVWLFDWVWFPTNRQGSLSLGPHHCVPIQRTERGQPSDLNQGRSLPGWRTLHCWDRHRPAGGCIGSVRWWNQCGPPGGTDLGVTFHFHHVAESPCTMERQPWSAPRW